MIATPASAKKMKKKSKKRKKEKTHTEFNFEETMLEGRMKVPSVSMLQGRVSQSKDNMIRLRGNFRKRLIRSKSGVRATKYR